MKNRVMLFEEFVYSLNENREKDLVDPSEVITHSLQVQNKYSEFKKLEKKYGFNLEKSTWYDNVYLIKISKSDLYKFYTTDYPRIMFPELFVGNKNENIELEIPIPSGLGLSHAANKAVMRGLKKYGYSIQPPYESKEIGGTVYKIKGERNKLLQFVTTEYLDVLEPKLFILNPERIKADESAKIGSADWETIMNGLIKLGWKRIDRKLNSDVLLGIDFELGLENDIEDAKIAISPQSANSSIINWCVFYNYQNSTEAYGDFNAKDYTAKKLDNDIYNSRSKIGKQIKWGS